MVQVVEVQMVSVDAQFVIFLRASFVPQSRFYVYQSWGSKFVFGRMWNHELHLVTPWFKFLLLKNLVINFGLSFHA